MAYVQIDGVKYEKALLDLAKSHTTGKGEGKLSYEEVQDIIKSAKDGVTVTDTEYATLQYIRKNFEFTDKAAHFMDGALFALAKE